MTWSAYVWSPEDIPRNTVDSGLMAAGKREVTQPQRMELV